MKNKRKIVCVLISLVLLACVIRVIYLNNKYQSPQKVTYEAGTTMSYFESDINIVSYYIYSREQMKNILDEYDYENIFDEKFTSGKQETKVILVTLKICNNTENIINPGYLSILSGSVCNGLNMQLTNVLNVDGYRVDGNSEKEVTIAYTITKNNVPKKQWENFESEKFSLTYENRTCYEILNLN